MTYVIADLLLILFTAVPVSGQVFDLLQIGHIQSKGRVQDSPGDPVIAAILSSRVDALPRLIDLIESERMYERSPLDLWPQVREGDIALVILCDLFLDPTCKKSALPELCWDTLLQRSDSTVPAWQLLEHYLETNGRASLAHKWRAAWLTHRDAIVWDEQGKYFTVPGKDLVECP